MMKKNIHTKTTLKWINDVTGSSRLLVLLLVILQALLSLTSIFYALILRRIINAAVDGERQMFFSAIAILIGVLCFQIFIQAVSRFFNEYTSTTVENRLKERLFSSLLSGNYASVTATHSGEWMNRLTSDTVVTAGVILSIPKC